MKRRELLTLTAAAIAWPRLALAQESRRVIGYVGNMTPVAELPRAVATFLQDLKSAGFVEGRNVDIEYRSAEGHYERLPSLLADLTGRNVAVLIVFGNLAIDAAQRSSTRIPIVGMADDMVKSGLAASMARPGGNTTGLSIFASELDAKRLELLHEAVPNAKRIGVLADPRTISTRPQLDKAARDFDLELVVVNARDSEEIAHGLDKLQSAHIDGVNVLSSPILDVARGLIIERLNEGRFPAIYQWPDTAEEGGLLAYGPRKQLCLQHMARLVAKILRGSRPEDLPIEQPEKFEFVVNLKTAKEIGLTIPPAIVARADKVIE
jgi:putative ABC transport system substrate-binding protein